MPIVNGGGIAFRWKHEKEKSEGYLVNRNQTGSTESHFLTGEKYSFQLMKNVLRINVIDLL